MSDIALGTGCATVNKRGKKIPVFTEITFSG